MLADFKSAPDFIYAFDKPSTGAAAPQAAGSFNTCHGFIMINMKR
jgi:hypothetical protein